jgi:hypothetical protein
MKRLQQSGEEGLHVRSVQTLFEVPGEQGREEV